MKRNFYLVMEVIRRKLPQESPQEIIETIFPTLDKWLKNHLVYKFNEGKSKHTPFFIALLNLYMALDSENQLIFDNWFNKEIDKLDANTAQHVIY